MPVRRFRDVAQMAEMEDSLWRAPGDPDLWHAIDRVWRFAAKTFPRRFPPGVYRHRSIEHAKRQREAWAEEDFRALWKRRGIDPAELGKKKP